MHIGTVRETIARVAVPSRARASFSPPSRTRPRQIPGGEARSPRGSNGRKSSARVANRAPRTGEGARGTAAGGSPFTPRRRRNLRTRADASERDGTHREASARRSGSGNRLRAGVPPGAPKPLRPLRPLTPALFRSPSPRTCSFLAGERGNEATPISPPLPQPPAHASALGVDSHPEPSSAPPRAFAPPFEPRVPSPDGARDFRGPPPPTRTRTRRRGNTRAPRRTPPT